MSPLSETKLGSRLAKFHGPHTESISLECCTRLRQKRITVVKITCFLNTVETASKNHAILSKSLLLSFGIAWMDRSLLEWGLATRNFSQACTHTARELRRFFELLLIHRREKE